MGFEAVGETSSLTGEFVRETHRILEHTEDHPPKNHHQKGTISFGVVGQVTERRERTEQVGLFPLGPLPHIQHHNAATWVAPPW